MSNIQNIDQHIIINLSLIHIYFALYADRLVSGSERIFLYSELPYRSGRHQFRPYRDNKNRQVCVESFVHDARLGIDDCCHCPGTALYTNILIYIY